MKRRFRAPGRVRPSEAPRTREAILADYHHAHTVVRQVIDAAAAVDINRATLPNPFLRIVRMKVCTALLVLAAHDRRHLWQAEQIRTAPDFPPPIARSL